MIAVADDAVTRRLLQLDSSFVPESVAFPDTPTNVAVQIGVATKKRVEHREDSERQRML